MNISRKWRPLFVSIAAIALMGIFGCDWMKESAPQGQGPDANALNIIAGSENREQEADILEWSRRNNCAVSVTYMGSVDISRQIGQGKQCAFDAALPAASLWLKYNDPQRVVKYEKSIKRSPVVLGVKKSIAERLKWTNNARVSMRDIFAAADAGKLRLSMSSATQSNSGTNTLFALFYAHAKNPDMLMMKHIEDEKIAARVTASLKSLNRGSGSSGWLMEAMVEYPEKFDAMFNYEAMVISANRGWNDKNGNHVPGLVERRGDPLVVVYPVDGMMIADSPLAYIDKGNAQKEAQFKSLQEYLLSKKVQDRVCQLGWRTGLLGLSVDNADPNVWNPAWGVDAKREIVTVPTPEPDVIRAALGLYQVGLRKPSLTVWLLDYSGSMGGRGEKGLKEGMGIILDPAQSEANLLQASRKDVNIVIMYSSEVRQPVLRVYGNKPEELMQALRAVYNESPGGGTATYDAAKMALDEFAKFSNDNTLRNYLPSIIIMTDGKSNQGLTLEQFLGLRRQYPFASDIPIHTVGYGDVDESELTRVAREGSGRYFKAKDLAQTMREVRGYN